MKTQTTTSGIQQSLLRVGLVTAGILMIPMIAMQFTSEMQWDHTDFIVFGILISATGLLIELVRGKVRNTNYRVGLFITVVLAFLYIWAELAVGVFTNWGS